MWQISCTILYIWFPCLLIIQYTRMWTNVNHRQLCFWKHNVIEHIISPYFNSQYTAQYIQKIHCMVDSEISGNTQGVTRDEKVLRSRPVRVASAVPNWFNKGLVTCKTVNEHIKAQTKLSMCTYKHNCLYTSLVGSFNKIGCLPGPGISLLPICEWWLASPSSINQILYI